MFTGIVEEVGKVLDVQKTNTAAHFKIEAPQIMTDVKLGDSIAVNGICLTVTSFSATCFTVDVMHETLNRSSIKALGKGSPGKSGTGDAGGWQIWRAYCQRTYRWHRRDPIGKTGRNRGVV